MHHKAVLQVKRKSPEVMLHLHTPTLINTVSHCLSENTQPHLAAVTHAGCRWVTSSFAGMDRGPAAQTR